MEFSSAEAYFNHLLPYAIQFGMPIKDFWHSSPELYWAYQVVYYRGLLERMEFENYKAWLQGLYNTEAFSVVEYNVNRGSNVAPAQYMEKPIDLFGTYALAQEKIDRADELRRKKLAQLETNMKINFARVKGILDRKKEGKVK